MNKRFRLFVSIGLLIILFSVSSCATTTGNILTDFALKRKNPNGLESRIISIKENSKIKSLENGKENYASLEEKMKEWISTAPKKEYEIQSFDGIRLSAEFYPKMDSDKYAILVHGYLSSLGKYYMLASYYADWGYNVLIVNDRAHRNSEGKWIGMGWLDAKDLQIWINRIKDENFNAKIVAHGISMGGSAVMMLSGFEIPDNVKCIISDCGYTSVYEEFSHVMKTKTLLNPDKWMPMVEKTTENKAGYNLHDASSENQLMKAKLPILFIHGTEDNFVPYSMLDENIKAYNGPYYEELRVSGAQHAVSLYADPELYTSTVRNFIDKFIQ